MRAQDVKHTINFEWPYGYSPDLLKCFRITRLIKILICFRICSPASYSLERDVRDSSWQVLEHSQGEILMNLVILKHSQKVFYVYIIIIKCVKVPASRGQQNSLYRYSKSLSSQVGNHKHLF